MRLSTTVKSLASVVTVCCVSVTPTFANTVTVQRGQSLWNIAKSEHVSLKSLQAANPSVDPANLLVGTRLQIPGTSTYVIKPGDTLWRVARKYNLSVSSVVRANPRVNTANLLVGTRINLPTTAAVSSSGIQKGTSSGQSNLYWMEHIINAEAGGQPLRTQIAVGDVILHRLESGKYGTSVKDVVFQISNGHYQFTPVANGFIYTSPNASSITAANDVLAKHLDLVPGAYVFYNPAQTPSGSWVWNQPTIAKIGSLVFAK